MKRLSKVNITWSSKFAYAVGLIVTDGCLSGDGRHIDLTSKDKEQIINFRKCLGIKTKIGYKSSGMGIRYFRVEFGDINFYNFLLNIGLMPNKTKIIREITIPKKYFFDFLRGHFDGDGSFYSYWDKRWRSSFMFYTEFVSASEEHILWLRKEIKKRIGIRGHITKSKNSCVLQLKYAKAESLILLKKIYYDESVICLSRKRNKINKTLRGWRNW